MTATIRETTHHGDYRHTRTVELPAPFTWADIQAMVRECPYRYDIGADVALRYAQALQSPGDTVAHGWTDWELVSITDGPVTLECGHTFAPDAPELESDYCPRCFDGFHRFAGSV